MSNRPGPMIDVHCTDVSHASKRVYVARFIRNDVMAESWTEFPRPYRPKHGLVHALETLDADNTPLPAGASFVEAAPIRHRYNLKCSRCGLAVPARQENLAPVLDRLAENGVEAVELANLAAILR